MAKNHETAVYYLSRLCSLRSKRFRGAKSEEETGLSAFLPLPHPLLLIFALAPFFARAKRRKLFAPRKRSLRRYVTHRHNVEYQNALVSKRRTLLSWKVVNRYTFGTSYRPDKDKTFQNTEE